MYVIAFFIEGIYEPMNRTNPMNRLFITLKNSMLDDVHHSDNEPVCDSLCPC